MLEEITSLPRRFVRDIDSVTSRLAVYLVQDFNNQLLRRMVKFGFDIFGDLAIDEFALVPQIRHGNVYLLKEKDKPRVIGLANLMRVWDADDKVYLSDIAIRDEAAGHGLGYEFMRIIAESLVEQGFHVMGLTVDTENEPAIRLYQDKLGFEIVEFKKNEYGKGHDRYYMEWDMVRFLDQAEA